MRYFFVSAIGKRLGSGNQPATNFIHEIEGFPTLPSLNEVAKKLGLTEPVIMSICELTKADAEVLAG